ncbi:MAG: 50S ribosomal protein L25 [Candidatus Pristimantibacillus lignocellulolyticus]|uniref:Large ribosomal subunit protein bL25 n=1 Tax=Candidatus Pristimantibacillus lignocellulolyticus TaxID=2994561 RepID=A0A9J6ZF36_9BACL|nr:MAG: 50S ribosomal protein L25 [Candidatus Pristimantibacillus lignocellulolyticus]
METNCIQAVERLYQKPSELRHLRNNGRLPGILFGKNISNQMFHIPVTSFQKWIRQGSGPLQLQFTNQDPVSVVIEELQQNPITMELLHVDFQVVQRNEILRTKLPVKLKGVPAGTKLGGVLQTQNTFVEVEALPKYLPKSIEIDISHMEIGHFLLMKDIPLPPEVIMISGENEQLVSLIKP